MRDRSVGFAVLLAVLFGPLGLLYASVIGGAVLIVLSAAAVVPTFGFVLIFVWPASIVWAAIAASNKHRDFLAAGHAGPLAV